MRNAEKLAKQLVNKVYGFQKRREAAQKTWWSMIEVLTEEVEELRVELQKEFRKVTKPRVEFEVNPQPNETAAKVNLQPNGTPANKMTVSVSLSTLADATSGPNATNQQAKVCFELDPYELHVKAIRTPFQCVNKEDSQHKPSEDPAASGDKPSDDPAASDDKPSYDLGDPESIKVDVFVKHVVRFLQWALAGKGNKKGPPRFSFNE